MLQWVSLVDKGREGGEERDLLVVGLFEEEVGVGSELNVISGGSWMRSKYDFSSNRG